MRRRHLVLDSYAILAWLEGEPSGSVVGGLLEQAARDEITLSLSVVNLGEVAYIVEREVSLQAAQSALALIDSLPVQQHDATRSSALQAAHFKARYRMAYADCFALALAQRLGATLVTGDPEFRTQQEIPLLWVGPE